jgi:uncharacterized membrane protein
MNENVTPSHSWLAVTSFIISLLALCTLPLPLIPSDLLGGVGLVLGIIALRRIQKKGGTNRDRFIALAGIGLGILPVISFCITVTFLAREIPRLAVLLSEKIAQLIIFLSREIPRLTALLSNLFR